MISLEMFIHGFYVLRFDPTPDLEADEENIYLPRQGNVRFEARFKTHCRNLLLAFLC